MREDRYAPYSENVIHHSQQGGASLSLSIFTHKNPQRLLLSASSGVTLSSNVAMVAPFPKFGDSVSLLFGAFYRITPIISRIVDGLMVENSGPFPFLQHPIVSFQVALLQRYKKVKKHSWCIKGRTGVKVLVENVTKAKYEDHW